MHSGERDYAEQKPIYPAENTGQKPKLHITLSSA
jgi:hypothetical protein